MPSSELRARLERERQLASAAREKQLRQQLLDKHLKKWAAKDLDSDYRGEKNATLPTNSRFGPRVPCAIVIDHIDSKIHAKKIIERLEEAAPVESVLLFGRHKAVAFFREDRRLMRAIYMLNGRYGWMVREAYNGDIQESKSEPERIVAPPRTVYVGNLSFEVTDTDFEEMLRSYLESKDSLVACRIELNSAGRSRGYGFAMFQDGATADKIATQLDQLEWQGRRLTAELSSKILEPAPPKPRCVVLSNMFDPCQETEENWVEDLEEDVLTECEEKYGRIVHIAVEPTAAGEVYIKFSDALGAAKALKALDGRFFGGKRVSVHKINESVYNTRYPKSQGH